VSDWFHDLELAFALGLTISIARLGTVLNYVIGPPIKNYVGSLAYAFWVGCLMCLISQVCGLISVMIDQRVEKKSNFSVNIFR
jgi:hypothetical protein